MTCQLNSTHSLSRFAPWLALLILRRGPNLATAITALNANSPISFMSLRDSTLAGLRALSHWGVMG